MVFGLFSSFDPGVYGSDMMTKWVCLVIPSVLFYQMFVMNNSPMLVFKQFVKFFYLESGSKRTIPLIMVVSMFIFLLSSNILSLIPCFFASTAHMVINLSFSLSLWLAGVVLSIKNSLKSALAHLLPSGSPLLLWPLLVLVETTSLMIRPFTLAIRLMANIMAGHLIINLIGSFLKGSASLMGVGILLQSGFIFFEFFVSMVQAYVFVSLLALYWSEA